MPFSTSSKGKEPRRCGISWLWLLPKSHPFTPACKYHDAAYDYKISGDIRDKTSERVDRRFLIAMLDFAKDSTRLKFQAYLFYILARIWGHYRWPRKKERY